MRCRNQAKRGKDEGVMKKERGAKAGKQNMRALDINRAETSHERRRADMGKCKVNGNGRWDARSHKTIWFASLHGVL